MRLIAGRKAAKKRGAGGLIGWIVGSDGSAMQVPGYTRLIDCPEVAAAVDAIAGSVSSMTIHLMENTKAGDVRVRDALGQTCGLHTQYGFAEAVQRVRVARYERLGRD